MRTARREIDGSIDLSKLRKWFADGEDTEHTDEIDWDDILTRIPKDKLNLIPAYKDVVTESITRRQTIQKLKKDLDELTAKDEKPEEKPAVQTSETEMPEWAKQLQATIETLATANLSTWQKEAADAVGINDPEITAYLKGANRDEIFAHAERLAKSLGIPKPVKPLISAGNPAEQRDKSVVNQAKARLRGSRASSSVFSLESQRAVGGGILLNE